MIDFGMDWYPEQWDPSYWDEDLRRMKALGISVVRIGEFAWSRMEPEEGKFTFDWLDTVMDLAKKHDMKVILGTPTNCPPVWMYKNHPETIRMDKEGQRIHYGVRGHRCMTSEKLRFYTQRILKQLTDRYKDSPVLYGWQIDNELEANSCTCPECTQQFVSWLQKQYPDLQSLNDAWGMAFWSGDYASWDEITLQHPANRALGWYNPAFTLAVERWKAESLNDFVQFQRDLLKEATPNLPVTTNFCLNRETPGYHSLSRLLDVSSYDNYTPNALYDKRNPWSYSNGIILDYVRGFKRQNFWVMEQLAGPMGCWGPIQPAPIPGLLEGYGLQAIAHGCNLEVFFRWRTAAKGAEMFCYGLLDHNNKPNRRMKEVENLIRRVQAIDDLDQTKVDAKIAILYGRDQEQSLKVQNQGFDYWDQIRKIHGALTKLGQTVDLIDQSEALDDYDLVIVPNHFVYEPGLEKRLAAFAAQGKMVLLTARSGVKDEIGNCFEKVSIPGPFSSLCGIEVTESDALGHDVSSITFIDQAEKSPKTNAFSSYPISGWADLIEVTSAIPVAVYSDRFYADTPAITRNQHGQGSVWYAGALLEVDGYEELFTRMLNEASIAIEKLPDGLEKTIRKNDQNIYAFYFNNTDQPQQTKINGGLVEFEPLEAKILKNEKAWL